MPAQEYAIISRDIRAVEIPQGTPALLATGTHVRITQSLGGSYTVVTDQGQLVRIEARDADAIDARNGYRYAGAFCLMARQRKASAPDGDVLPIFIVTGVRYRVDALL